MAVAAKTQAANPPMPPVRVWALPVFLAWLIPGAGHFILRRRSRALLIFAAVTLMFAAGLLMRGAMFKPESGDLLTTLLSYGGFFGNLASGGLYLLATMFGYSQPDVAGDVHDYGSKFLVTAGLLNILAMVDAFDIASGRKD